MSQGCRGCRRTLPAAPLRELIALRTLELGGVNAMLARVALRLNRDVHAVECACARILKSETVTIAVADDWAIALGAMPNGLWGRAWRDLDDAVAM